MTYITIDAVDEEGRPCEVLLDRGAVPKNGEWFEDEGRRLQRVPSRVTGLRVKSYDFVANSLPREHHARKNGFSLAPHYDAKGRAAFSTRRELEDYISRHNDNPTNGTQLDWDPDGNE